MSQKLLLFAEQSKIVSRGPMRVLRMCQLGGEFDCNVEFWDWSNEKGAASLHAPMF